MPMTLVIWISLQFPVATYVSRGMARLWQLMQRILSAPSELLAVGMPGSNIFFLLLTKLIHVSLVLSSDEDQVHERMYGGKRVEISQYPYFVTLFNPEMSRAAAICGGGLIARRWIITASHCQTNDSLGMRVAFGLTNVTVGDPTKIGFHTKSMTRHPLWRGQGHTRYDLALIKVPESVKHEWMPILLPLPGDDRNYIDSQMTAKLLAIGPSTPYPSTHTLDKDQGGILKTTEASLSRFLCWHWLQWFPFAWNRGRLDSTTFTPSEVCIVFPPLLDYDFKHKFFLCPYDDGALSVISQRGEQVLQGIMVSAPYDACLHSLFFRKDRYLMKETASFVRIEPEMAFILHTIDESETPHDLAPTMNVWMTYPPIMSRFLAQVD